MWTLFQENQNFNWPPHPNIERYCQSAPPVGLCSPPDPEKRNARKLYATIHKSSAIAKTPSLYSVFEQNSEDTKTDRQFLLSENNMDTNIEENSTQMLANFIPIKSSVQQSESIAINANTSLESSNLLNSVGSFSQISNLG